jgi:DHA1 family inner membrane transport protein
MTSQMSHIVQKAPPSEQASKIDLRILLLALASFALGTDSLIVVGTLPVIARETHVTEGVAGLLVTAFSLTYALVGPVLVALAGRWPSNRVLIGALGAFCLTNVGAALSPTFTLLFIMRVLSGCFAALYSPLAYAIGISLAPPEKRGQTLSLILGGSTVATILGGPLGTWIGEQFGWRMSFGLVAVVSGLAFTVILLYALPKPAAARTLSLKAQLAPVREPRLLLALSPAFLWLLGFYAVYTYLAPLLEQNLHVSDVSGFLLVFGLGTISGSWLGGRIADRFGATRPIIAGLVALAVILSLASLMTTQLFGALLVLLILGMSMPSLFVAQQHRMLGLAPEHANVISALNISMMYLGVAIGAALGSTALHYVPLTQLGWVGAGFTLLALLIFLFSVRTSKSDIRSAEKSLGK